MTNNELLGKRLLRAIQARGISQKELAEKLYVTPQAISQWVHGKSRPDQEYWKSLQELLGINVINILFNTENTGETKMNITPLEQTTDIETLNQAVNEIVDNCLIDQTYKYTITEMLKHTLHLVIAYEIYYEEITHHHDDAGEPVDWSWIADDIREMLMSDKAFPFPMPMGFKLSSFPFRNPGFLLSNQLEWMAYKIGGELFEEVAEERHTPEYLLNVGQKGEFSGYVLNSMLPSAENEVVTLFKVALFNLIKVLHSCECEDSD